jgi:hypothetical protein
MAHSLGASQRILSGTNFLCGNNAEHTLGLVESHNKFANLIAIQLFPATAVNQGALNSSEVFQVHHQVSKPISCCEQDLLSWKQLGSPEINGRVLRQLYVGVELPRAHTSLNDLGVT